MRRMTWRAISTRPWLQEPTDRAVFRQVGRAFRAMVELGVGTIHYNAHF